MIKWGPIVVFILVQIFSAGLIVQRVASLETKVNGLVPRAEWETMNRARDTQIQMLIRADEGNSRRLDTIDNH